jgi:hypothetical protein
MCLYNCGAKAESVLPEPPQQTVETSTCLPAQSVITDII